MARKTDQQVPPDAVDSDHAPRGEDAVDGVGASAPSQSRARKRRSLLLGASCAIILLGVAALAVVLQERITASALEGEEWLDAAAYVRANYQPGDIVRIEPVWADDPRVLLEGAEFDLTSRPDTEVLDLYDRVWIVAGMRRGDDVVQTMPSNYTLEQRERFDRVDVLLYAVHPEREVLFDFREHVHSARVHRDYPNRRDEDCTLWRDDAWYCGRVDKFLYVAASLMDMDSEPRRCIYMPPIDADGWVELTFEDVPVGATIEGRAGNNNRAVRAKRGGATDFAVNIDGRERFSIRIDPHDPTFHAFRIDTSKAKGTQSVTFRTHATNALDRFFCFTARVRGS